MKQLSLGINSKNECSDYEKPRNFDNDWVFLGIDKNPQEKNGRRLLK